MPKESREIALLDYTFVFNPREVWARRSDFESALATLLKTQGLEAEIIKTVGSDKRVLHIYSTKR